MRYFIGFLITIGLIILLIILLFSGGGKPKVPNSAKTLDSYAATDAEVSMLIDGPVNAQSLHQQLKVTVSRDNVTYEEMQGYDGNVVNTKVYPNSENAYTAFLLSLARAGFTRSSSDSSLKDERGYCPLGDRYVFELKQDANTILRSWSTSCGKPKTFLGSQGLTIQLFQNQVPDYNELAQNLKF